MHLFIHQTVIWKVYKRHQNLGDDGNTPKRMREKSYVNQGEI